MAVPGPKQLHREYSTENQHHLLQTDDYTLIERIRDILSDINEGDENQSHSGSIHSYLYHHFKATNNQPIKDRIDAVLNEIQKQDVIKRHDDPQLVASKIKQGAQPTSSDEFDELTPFHYKTKQQKLRNSDAYKKIKEYYDKQMTNLLQKKTKSDLFTESSMECVPPCTASTMFTCCEPLRRIDQVLCVYSKLMDEPSLWGMVPIAPLLTIEDIYGHPQMFNDFLHIKLFHIESQSQTHHDIDETDEKKKVAIDANDVSIAKTLCTAFQTKYKCEDIEKCSAFQRHYRDRTDVENERQLFYIAADAAVTSTKIREKMTDTEWIFQEECDKIHCYFFHSTIQFATRDDDDDFKANHRIDQINKFGSGRSWSDSSKAPKKAKGGKQIYVGTKEDKEWFDRFSTSKMSREEGYKLLIEHMGIFRWQSSHGFRTGQNRGLMHLKPKFSNFKEEALDNSYYRASKDNWNQTFRKSKLFYQSFARQRIRTRCAGSFKDEVSDMEFGWGGKEGIRLQEVITLKLYTDFDKLQHELKKCFRWETIVGLLNESSAHTAQDEKSDEDKRKELENRLQEFFHWRISLLTVLTKFGIEINENHLVLYHGVNAKMILNPAETMAFYGPLSTTSSYHVAKTFATAKGMVLQITSQFPRLHFCSAFDASLISDYPEESEYLISFMYLRVLQVRTRPIVTDITNRALWDAAPLESKTRVIFFSIHLFKEQMFSMSGHLEYWLVEFLKCNRLDCCEKCHDANDEHKSSFLSWLCCEIAHHPKARTSAAHWKERPLNQNPNRNIMTILWTKFNLFQNIPNMKQVIKIDRVSDKLKPFFLEQSGAKDVHGSDKYVVSFTKILEVFPNAKEIHFVNSYRFDNDTLQKLLNLVNAQQTGEEKRKREHVQKATNTGKRPSILSVLSDNYKNSSNDDDARLLIEDPPKPGLKKVVFLYYNFVDATDAKGRMCGYPMTGDTFYNPTELDATKLDQLESMNWSIKYGRNGNVGFKIRIFEKSDEEDHQHIFAQFTKQQKINNAIDTQT